jgi:hypothetical protein
MRVFLDLETICCPNSTQLNPNLVSKLSRKSRDSQHLTENADPQEQLRETALIPEYGQILAVGLIIEEKSQLLHAGVLGRDRQTMLFHADERRTLKALWNLLRGFHENRDVIVAHNAEFDISFLHKRSVIQGVKPSVRLDVPRYRSSHVFCTMKAWDLFCWRPGLKLSELAEVLRLNQRKLDGLDGSQVEEMYREGSTESHQQIADYCMRDVEMTREIYYRMSFEQGASLR